MTLAPLSQEHKATLRALANQWRAALHRGDITLEQAATQTARGMFPGPPPPPSLYAAAYVYARHILPPCETYVSMYCNFAHHVPTGKPIEHECYVLPPDALIAEMRDDYDRACELIGLARPMRLMRRGITIRKPKP